MRDFLVISRIEKMRTIEVSGGDISHHARRQSGPAGVN